VIEVGQNLNGRKVNAIVNGVAFSFQRRGYCETQTYTWVFRWDDDRWFDAGDPWPSVIVPRKDLEDLAAKRPVVMP
jgi:hypothetical protein